MELNVFTIVLLVVAALFGGFGARLLRLPPILGYVVAGVIFGFVGREYVSSESLHAIFELGISFLLFTLGFEFSMGKLRQANKSVFFAGLFQALLVVVVLFPIFLLFRISLPVAMLFAFIFAFSSIAVVVKMLEERGALDSFPGSHVYLFLLVQGILILPVVYLIPVIFSESLGVFAIGEVILSGLGALAIFSLTYFVGKLFVSRLVNIIFKSPVREFSLLVIVLIAFLSIGLFTIVGVPQSVAAFLAGVLVSAHRKQMSILVSFRPLRDVLMILFFVMVGMLLDLDVLMGALPLVVFLSVLVLGAKFLSIFIVLRSASYLLFPTVFISSYLAHIGEFSVVLGYVAYAQGYIDISSFNLVLSIFVVLLVTMPFLVKYIHGAFEYVVDRGWMGEKGRGELASHMVARDTTELRNHVVICGAGRVEREVSHLLDDAGISYVVVSLGKNSDEQMKKAAIEGDPSDPEVLSAAGIGDAKALVVGVLDEDSQNKIIKSALSRNPKIAIICHSQEEKRRYDLLNLGANTVVIPEFEAGVRIGHAVLDVYGVKRDKILSVIKRLRRQNFID